MCQVSDYKCPSCPCLFCTETDLARHLRTFGSDHLEKYQKLHKQIEFGVSEGNEQKGWRKGKYGEWCFAEDEPRLASLALQNGSVSMGNFLITLDPSGKFLRKKVNHY